MSMMECGHCHRAADARSMNACDGCSRMICNDCYGGTSECPGDDVDDER